MNRPIARERLAAILMAMALAGCSYAPIPPLATPAVPATSLQVSDRFRADGAQRALVGTAYCSECREVRGS